MVEYYIVVWLCIFSMCTWYISFATLLVVLPWWFFFQVLVSSVLHFNLPASSVINYAVFLMWLSLPWSFGVSHLLYLVLLCPALPWWSRTELCFGFGGWQSSSSSLCLLAFGFLPWGLVVPCLTWSPLSFSLRKCLHPEVILFWMQAVQDTCFRGLRKPRLSEAKASFSQTERAGILLVPPTDKGLSSRPSVDFLFLLLASNTVYFHLDGLACLATCPPARQHPHGFLPFNG